MKYVKYIIVVIVIILLLVPFFFKKKLVLYNKDYFYMDTIINVKFYCNDSVKAKSIIDGIDEIYSDYHILTDRYNSYEGVNNVYYINHNKDNSKEIVLDSRLYDLINYGLSLYDKSNKLFDINLGGVIDVWKAYREKKEGIPTKFELKEANVKNSVKLLSDNKILNNHPSIDLGAIAKGYTTKLVGEYLKEKGINYYIINAGGNVLVGDAYNKDYYKIGIQSPSDSGIIYVYNGKNTSVVTSGGYERNYVYDGVMYHHIISPKTLYPTDYMKSVTVIGPDSGICDFLSTTLFLMSIDDGKEFIKDYDVKVLWVDNENTLIFSEGFDE